MLGTNWFSRMKLSAKPFRFVAQCDRFRSQPGGEEKWQEMMKNRQEVTQQEFINNCDISPLLDDGESEQQYIAYTLGADSGTLFSRSTIESKPVYFLQTRGFEYIFMQ